MDHTTTSPTPTTENLQERSGFVKIPWVSRIAYGLGDTSCNVVYGMINTLLTLFYTDYAGIPFVTVGLVMLISRFFDGSSDVIMGVVVSKTRSRWGSSRPWLLWTALPLCHHLGCPVYRTADFWKSPVLVHLRDI